MHHILIVASWFPSEQHPVVGRFVEEQARILQRQYAVTVVAPEMHRWRSRFRGARQHIQVEVAHNLVIVRAQAVPRLPRNATVRMAAYLDAVRRAARAAEELNGRPDVIHAHVVLPGGWAAAKIGQERQTPVILTEHSNPFAMHLQTPHDRRLARWTLGHVDQIVAVSPASAQQIEAFLPEANVNVIGNVVDTEYFTPGERMSDGRGDRPFRVLSVGMLVAKKGMDRVLEAIAEAAGQCTRPLEVVIGGDGPELSSLEAMASQLGIDGRVSFAGALDREQVRDWMRWCDLFVLASDHETFGVVAAEAMSCGKRVVATRSGGVEFVIQDGTGVLVPRGDIEAIARAILDAAEGRLVLDAELARDSIVTRFGPSAFLDQVSRVYDRVITGRAHPSSFGHVSPSGLP